MKYNFTDSGVPISKEGYTQQRKSNTDTKVLEFVQKIVSAISLFLKPKNSPSVSSTPQNSVDKTTLEEQLFIESNLQEFLQDKLSPQLNKNNIKHVPDLMLNQDLTMHKLSSNWNSTVKDYHLSSHFDQKLKRWTSTLSAKKIRHEGEDNYTKNSYFKGMATTIMLLLISVLSTVAQSSIDLSLRKEVDKSMPAINESIKYTLWLKNSGPSTANSIVVKDNFPVDGAVLNTHTGGANFTYNPTTGVGNWNVASLAVGDSVKLEINATVLQQGVFFNTAEVFSIGTGQEDFDSTPNNSKLYEDDIASACFSVPLHWYPGEEYTVSVPAPFKYGSSIKWFDGNTEITPSSTVAVVNPDSSLTIKAPGVFTFKTNVSNCPAQGCCAVQVIQGPYGSIGDYVWQDTNNDGQQGPSTTEPPVAGVKVFLLSATGTRLDSTVTDAQGKYLFDSLTTDSYRVQFVKPAGYDLFTTQNLGTDDTKDSDVGPSGLSQLINIDTSKLPTDTLRNNLNIDAGLKPNYGSIGNYVWTDVNNNGQQDSGEAPIAGVKVYLLSATGAKIDSTITNASGLYLFDSLTSGSYRIQFVAPAGTIAAKQNTGADVTDSDANKNGISQLISIDTTKPTTDTLRNNLQIDAGFVPVGSIGDYVFADNNGDGIQNAGDSPLAGVKVYLLSATGAKLDSTITNASGRYLFDSLLAGNYQIKFVLPVGSEATGKLLGGNTANDSNINPDGSTDTIVIDTTQPIGSIARNNTSVDAGLKTAFGSIGNYVWTDVNNNGQQD
ncbi:MAG: SdrD B-like domain-containing protein, partial [Emticicia sp.]|uniref:SdrD B-like domain-containing protein n=1 Tax=Emticicia sp. TaxID=1930953 RepID=UPI003BA4A3D6